MKNKIIFTGLLLSVLALSTLAQVAMGKWRTHFAYNSVTQIAQSESKIYAVSEGALFSIDKQDEGLEFYSKISGLNGANISRIEFDRTYNQLLIVYANGNIDVMGSGGVTNIPDFYNKQINTSKDVNQINFYNNRAYLATNFGIIVINMQKKEVADTYFIGPNASEVKVLNTAVHNGIIYALTATKLYKASANEPNLVNYEFWSTTNELPGSGDLQSVCSFAEKLIILRGARLYKQESDNSWTALLPDLDVSGLHVTDGKLNVYAANNVYFVDNSFNSKLVSDIGILSDAEYDNESDTYWFAANNLGVIAYSKADTQTPEVKYFKPNGPAVNIPWNMTFAGKKLFVVPGGRWSGHFARLGNVMIYENGNWNNILAKDIQDQTGQNVFDFMNIAVNPLDDKHFFATSYGTGLYEFKDNLFYKWHNHISESPKTTIETLVPQEPFGYIRLDGAVYDKDRNLFFVNIAAPGGEIKVLMADGTWSQLFFTGFRPTLGKILMPRQNPNHKWIASVRSTPGLFIFDDRGTITDQSDDPAPVFYYPFVYPETENGQTVMVSVSPSAVYTLEQDKNGVIWVGTDQGPFLFHNPSKAFDSDFVCARVKIPRKDDSGQADYLLKEEKIKAIAIDGANRKWLGTESSGVYLMSENGQETIEHFTVSNSPLLSNDILSIAINPITGEVFIGTGQGLVSYQSDANEASSKFDNVYAYPNPVRQGYTGIITITGLVEKTQVKITDLNGNLVCQTVSNGSIATWDGKDMYGRKVSTGIYLAICANADGTESTITKILVIN
jgi:hypothetical protein